MATRGDAPLAVHLVYAGFLDDGVPKERTLDFLCCRASLLAADEVWAFGTPSAGMAAEIVEAERAGKLVRYLP